MYSINEIQRLQYDDDFREREGDRYCLISVYNRELTPRDVDNQANFCILQVINAYKDKYISKTEANRILNKIDAFIYGKDMLGIQRTIEKLNKEIIEEELHIPHFYSLCVVCDELYDSFQQ